MNIKSDEVDLINKVTTLISIKCWYPKNIVRLGKLSYVHNAVGKDIATVKYGVFDYLYSQKGGIDSTVADSYCDRFIETGYFADKNKDRYPIISLGIMECYAILDDIFYFYHHIFNSKLEKLKGSESPKNVRKAFRRCSYDYKYRCSIHNSVVAVKKIVNIYKKDITLSKAMADVYKVAGKPIEMIEKHGLFDVAKEYIKMNNTNPFCTECKDEYAALFAFKDAFITLAGLGEAFRDVHCGSEYNLSKGYDVKFTIEPTKDGYVLRIKREKKEGSHMFTRVINDLDQAKKDINYFIETSKNPLAIPTIICTIWKDNTILNDPCNKKCIIMRFRNIYESEIFVQHLAKYVNALNPNNSINSAKDNGKIAQHISIKDANVIIDLKPNSESMVEKDTSIRCGLEKEKESSDDKVCDIDTAKLLISSYINEKGSIAAEKLENFISAKWGYVTSTHEDGVEKSISMKFSTPSQAENFVMTIAKSIFAPNLNLNSDKNRVTIGEDSTVTIDLGFTDDKTISKETIEMIDKENIISGKKDIINTWMNSKDYSAELIIDTAKNHYFLKNLEAGINPRNAFEEDEHVIESINVEFNDALEMYGFIIYLSMVIEHRFHTKAEKWVKGNIVISSDKKSIYFNCIKDGVEVDSVKEFNNNIIAKAIEDIKMVDKDCPFIYLLKYVMSDGYDDNKKTKNILYNLIGALNTTKSGMVKSNFILDAYLRYMKRK